MDAPLFEITVGVVKGQDGKTLTKQAYGMVEVIKEPPIGGPLTESNIETFVYSVVKGTKLTITPKVKDIQIDKIGNIKTRILKWTTDYEGKNNISSATLPDTLNNNIYTITSIRKNYTLYANFEIDKNSTNNITLIDSVSELEAIGTINTTGKNYVLIADLDLNDLTDEFFPIGVNHGEYEAITPFSGTFDGMGHIINFNNKLYTNITADYASFYGLFGKIGATGTVQNLRVTGIITNKQGNTFYAGGVAGENNGTIKNVISSVTIINSSENTACIGGIAGKNTGTIKNCASTATISGENKATVLNLGGGIVGLNEGASANIEYCWADGAISFSYLQSCDAGGIAGLNVQSAKIGNCVALNNKFSAANNGRIVAGTNDGMDSGTKPGILENNYATYQITWEDDYNDDPASLGPNGMQGADFTNTGASSWQSTNGPNWSTVLYADTATNHDDAPWVLPPKPKDATFRPKLYFEDN